MSRVLKRPEAERDLEDIWWYIAQDNLHHADRFLDRIEAYCASVALFPQTGTSREELLAGLRSSPIGHYVVFYIPLADGIDIVRVLHGARDVQAIFQERE